MLERTDLGPYLALLALATLVAACGSDTTSDKWDFDDTVDAGVACQRAEDCGEGAYCHEPSDCDAPTYCAEGQPPYSAAPPILACSCGGQITTVNAGYPGRHAWSAPGTFGFDHYAPDCDPDAEFPVTYTLELRLPDDRPSNLTARISSPDAAEDLELPVPADGTITGEIAGGAWLDIFIELLRDADDSGTCTIGDAVYNAYVENRAIDMSTFALVGDLRLQATPDPCDRW